MEARDLGRVRLHNVGELLCLLRQNHSNGAVSFIVGIKDDKDNLVPISEWVSEYKDEIKKYIEDENGVTDIERYNHILKDLGCVVPK